jgi:transcriptional antiterminator RfaH
MAKHWYTIRSKPRKEEIVWQQLLLRDYEAYLPFLHVNPVNPRAKKYIPYFPGYLFVNIDLDKTGISVFQWMPHTIGVVEFGGEPAIVPDNLIIALQKRIEYLNTKGSGVVDDLRKGDQIIIRDGPFKDYDAIFDSRVSGKERVRVLLRLLGDQRQIPIEMNINQIEKK